MSHSKPSSSHHIFLDGFILLFCSTVFVVSIDWTMGIFKDGQNQSNPLLTAVIQASSEENVSAKRAENNMKEIMENIKRVNQPDIHGDTALMMVCYANFYDYALANKADVARKPYVELFLKNGADVHLRDKDGWSALFWAAWSGLPRISLVLLESGADATLTDRQDNTIVAIAAQQGNPEVVKYLLSHRANPSVKNKEGMDALALGRRELSRYSATLSSFDNEVAIQLKDELQKNPDALISYWNKTEKIKEQSEATKEDSSDMEKEGSTGQDKIAQEEVIEKWTDLEKQLTPSIIRVARYYQTVEILESSSRQ